MGYFDFLSAPLRLRVRINNLNNPMLKGSRRGAKTQRVQRNDSETKKMELRFLASWLLNFFKSAFRATARAGG